MSLHRLFIGWIILAIVAIVPVIPAQADVLDHLVRAHNHEGPDDPARPLKTAYLGRTIKWLLDNPAPGTPANARNREKLAVWLNKFLSKGLGTLAAREPKFIMWYADKSKTAKPSIVEVLDFLDTYCPLPSRYPATYPDPLEHAGVRHLIGVGVDEMVNAAGERPDAVPEGDETCNQCKARTGSCFACLPNPCLSCP